MLGSWQSPALPLWSVLGFWGAITLVGDRRRGPDRSQARINCHQQKGRPTETAFPNRMSQSLTLGELEALTGFRLTVLLTLNNAAVACQEPSGFQSGSKRRIIKLKRF